MASGIVIIDKSPGWTSMDVCVRSLFTPGQSRSLLDISAR